jgi:hypothetical protein
MMMKKPSRSAKNVVYNIILTKTNNKCRKQKLTAGELPGGHPANMNRPKLFQQTHFLCNAPIAGGHFIQIDAGAYH